MKSLLILISLSLLHCASKSIYHEGLLYEQNKTLYGVITEKTALRYNQYGDFFILKIAQKQYPASYNLLDEKMKKLISYKQFSSYFASLGPFPSFTKKESEIARALPKTYGAVGKDDFSHYDSVVARYTLNYPSSKVNLDLYLSRAGDSGRLKVVGLRSQQLGKPVKFDAIIVEKKSGLQNKTYSKSYQN